MTVDCVVVGAGFAGLRAAQRLTEQGRTVTVLEARDRVGGRTCSGVVAGIDIDLGGMWLGPTQSRLDALTREQGLDAHGAPPRRRARVCARCKYRRDRRRDTSAPGHGPPP